MCTVNLIERLAYNNDLMIIYYIAGFKKFNRILTNAIAFRQHCDSVSIA